MTTELTSSCDRLKDLGDLLARGVSPEEFARHFFYLNLEQTHASDPELAQMLRVCAIPRRIDAAIIRVLREAQADTKTNERLLASLLPFSFVLARKDGGYVYHDNIRDMLLEDWRANEHRDQFDQLNQRLVTFYENQHEEVRKVEQDLGRISPVVRRASEAHYVQLASIVAVRVVAR